MSEVNARGGSAPSGLCFKASGQIDWTSTQLAGLGDPLCTGRSGQLLPFMTSDLTSAACLGSGCL